MLQSMGRRTIIWKLEAAGWRRVGVKDSHHPFRHPDDPNRVTVQHPRKDVPTGMIRSIERQSGVRLA
jgi:predicted RNA binding protein YcfA (HicA-like mRNA interferase family)